MTLISLVDTDELKSAVTKRTKILLINSPHNPTGAVLSRSESEAIAALAIEHDLIVISDEVYEHMAFDREHIPLASLPGMKERTLTISSAGKLISLTGWKIGWVSGPADLINAVRTIKQFLTFTSAGPFQYAIAKALNDGDAHRGSSTKGNLFRNNRCPLTRIRFSGCFLPGTSQADWRSGNSIACLL